ncbi:uncharacterized protein C4orf54 homolog [Myxocyprinus asiaticus]|uniref:uncharacterized protein C4orf54 homolog n=1 Tax=Myxocyprinus asiaticus TaxID=70543 RepID=UPI0022238CE1|nr:uncharacterized protein C4orf54 homolog [Myxocyprinus asiaticus]
MAASEKTLVYREDTDSFKNLLSNRDLHLIAAQEETNYVDLNDLLELKLDDTKTVKVTFTGDTSQLAIIKSIMKDSNAQLQGEDNQVPSNPSTDKINHAKQEECVEKSSSFETATSEVPQINKNDTECVESPVKVTERDTQEQLETQSAGNSESDDEVTVVLSDHGTPEMYEDESHYITTHEIQLLELDHDVDYDFETGSSWDIEDDHQVYSFVDYASFDSDETIGAKEADMKSNQAQSRTSGAVVSSKPESILCDTDKCASSDESLSKNQNTAGQIHLSIKATSRAINEPSNIQDHGKPSGDSSRHALKGVDAKRGKVSDNAKCFIAVPGRLHFGRKLKSKDVNEYSSGASSAVSELDDADKEVRNLTAKAFKSLAYPYFDAINFSTSSESSASEHGLGINRWSTFVDLKYGNVNMSKGRDQNLVAHEGTTSNFHFAKKRDCKGITGLTLTSMRAPPVEIFALNGSLVGHKNASSTTKKIELMGKFAQGQSGVIRLTETLNFRCNVKSDQSGNERRAKSAHNAEGSRSTDEVTDTLPSAQGCEASKRPCNAGETMEDAHKKAIFASSLLKNVISKKMQFEQERKMERGEICETHHAPSPCFATHEHEVQKEKVTKKNSKGLQRQNSKFSEADSDHTIVCVDELGDIVDSNSSDAKDDSRKEETLTSASETTLEPANEAAFDTKKGAFEASKSTLLRSQNSAFRSWRDGELEFQKEHKNDKTPEGKLPPTDRCPRETNAYIDPATSKNTKMSHLFVPSIQIPSGDRELRKPPPNMSYSMRNEGDSGGMRMRSNTLYVTDTTPRAVTSKSPEIKISLRSVRDNKSDPFNIAKLLTPNIGCNAASLIKTADDTRCHALATTFKGESTDKVPHFIVRDIRDNKGKLQTPIHQVRDVRKLVKSSYHFVSLDSNENKCCSDGEHKVLKPSSYLNSASLSPIVIKCQSVNTNSNVKQSGNLIDPAKRRFPEDIFESDRSSPQVHVEGAKNESATIQKQVNRLPSVKATQSNSKQDVPPGLKIETSTRRQDKTSDVGERIAEPKMANQAALEKLQAAVKTMEQLYVFDKNEWKRKTDPRPITDSHLLSLIASEEHGGAVEEQDSASSFPTTNMEKFVRRDSIPEKISARPPSTHTEMPAKKDEKDTPMSSTTPITHDERNGPKTPMQLTGTPCKNITLSHSQKPLATSSIKAPQTHVSSPASLSSKGVTPKSQKLPVSLKISKAKRVMEERKRQNSSEAELAPLQFTADAENYLTIPVKPHATSAIKPTTAALAKTAVYTIPATGGKTQTASPAPYLTHKESHQSPKRPSFVMETQSPDTPTATIYHTPLPVTMEAAQPQVICFSPTVQPSPVPTEHFQHTQKKMLLDPTTGNFYLVDTPVQPATRRLFDPETGQYVDVPVPQKPPMTPVPLPISPLALSPGAYGHTYMFYPGYMPTTMIPARTMQSQLSMQSEADDGDRSHSHLGQQEDGAYMESPYYMPYGKSSQTATVAQHVTTSRLAISKQPVISITSQQGPRIIAPPSFDGTTMSFVVEHR